MRSDGAGGLRQAEEYLWLGPVGAATLALFAISALAADGQGISVAAILADYGRTAMRLTPLLLELLFLFILVRASLSRAPDPLGRLIARAGRAFPSPAIALGRLAPLVLMPILITGCGVLKMVMPLRAPFLWDEQLAAGGRMLLFGYQPWQVTHAVFGGAYPTLALDRIYTAWVALLPVAIGGFALFAPRYERARFFLAFTAAWILLGVVGAYLGSSAGPCFAALIGAPDADRFAPLLASLNAMAGSGAELQALHWQSMLWDAYVHRQFVAGSGISAMPSMHNAIAILYAFALFRFGRLPGLAASLFAAAIFIGSIHLGWHYAADGLIALPAMAAIWWATGRYLARSGYVAALASAEAEAAAPCAPGGPVRVWSAFRRVA